MPVFLACKSHAVQEECITFLYHPLCAFIVHTDFKDVLRLFNPARVALVALRRDAQERNEEHGNKAYTNSEPEDTGKWCYGVICVVAGLWRIFLDSVEDGGGDTVSDSGTEPSQRLE